MEVDTSAACDNLLAVRNKEGRTSEVIAVLQEFLSQGRMSLKDFSKVMGRVQFADGKANLQWPRFAWSRGACGDLVLNESCRKAYLNLIRRFEAGEPRMIPCAPEGRVACIFTDGASEGCVNAVNVVAYLSGRPPRFFSCAVPDSLVRMVPFSRPHNRTC